MDKIYLSARLHNDKDIAQALAINATWMPTILKPHELSLMYDKDVFRLFNDSVVLKLYQT